MSLAGLERAGDGRVVFRGAGTRPRAFAVKTAVDRDADEARTRGLQNDLGDLVVVLVAARAMQRDHDGPRAAELRRVGQQ